MSYPNIYPNEFKDLVKNHTKNGDFIGFGNPYAYNNPTVRDDFGKFITGPILIIGKECALGNCFRDGKCAMSDKKTWDEIKKAIDIKGEKFLPSIICNECTLGNEGFRDSILACMEAGDNRKDWLSNIHNNYSAPKDVVFHLPTKYGFPIDGDDNLKNAMTQWQGIFNPLWPYMALSGTAKISTWSWYQKLVYGVNVNPALPYCFWQNAFVTEMSNVHSRTSNGINDPAVAASVNDRIDRILSKPFFKEFPYVVLACYDYIEVGGKGSTIANLKRIFGNNLKPIPIKGPKTKGLLGVYSNGSQTIVLTYQLSRWASNPLINAIVAQF